jgi:hypothetical protein
MDAGSDWMRRTDRQLRRQAQQILTEQLLLPIGRPPLETEDGKGPQHEDKAGLLLVILDNHEERTLLDVTGIGLHLQCFPLNEGVGLRPDNSHIQCMHQDECYQQ